LKALGIDALHELGIIHRDIKAGNILVDVRENVRIADFGLSYVAAYARPLDRQWACLTDVVGTPYIMAPEMLQFNVYAPDAMTYGPPVDWWALGCVLYQLVSPDHMARFASFFCCSLADTIFSGVISNTEGYIELCCVVHQQWWHAQAVPDL
jgi:serine/threonine protein kinase